MRRFMMLMLVAAVGCSTETVKEDGRDDSFTGGNGKADTAGITNGTPEADAILKIANTLSFDQLTKNVELSKKAAENIIAYREGDDASSMDDDVYISTLYELDAIPFVGPIAFAQMLLYVETEGLVMTGSSSDGGWMDNNDGGWWYSSDLGWDDPYDLSYKWDAGDLSHKWDAGDLSH